MRAARGGHREGGEDWKEDFDFGRWALQFHEYPLRGGQFHFRESTCREISAGSLHAARLYRPRGKTPDSVSRENVGAAFLRPRRERHHAVARGRVPRCGDSNISESTCEGGFPDDRVRCSDRRGRVSSTGPGRCNGRTFDSKDRRDVLWIRSSAAVWSEDSEDAASARSSDIFRKREEAILRFGRRFNGGNCQSR